jgi:hypothetical protein
MRQNSFQSDELDKYSAKEYLLSHVKKQEVISKSSSLSVLNYLRPSLAGLKLLLV